MGVITVDTLEGQLVSMQPDRGMKLFLCLTVIRQTLLGLAISGQVVELSLLSELKFSRGMDS
jgi:hypothetical protein